MAAQHVERARLQLFGPVRVFAADGIDVTPRGQKVLGLLAMLALARDGRLARVAAASRLWSGSHDAKANLRQCLRELRRALDAAGGGLLRTDDYELVLHREHLAVDAMALDGPAVDDVTLLGAFDDDCLLRDIEIADPLFDEWLALERSRWRDRLHQALETRAQARLAADDPAGAIALAARLVAFEPTLEAGHRVLMQGHAAQGNASLALRQFEFCRDSLESDLGVAPGAATLALRAAIARPPQRPQPRLTVPPAGTARRSVPCAASALAPPPARQLPEAPIRMELAAFRVLSPEPSDGLYAVVLGEAIGATLARSTALVVIDETLPQPATGRNALSDIGPDGGPGTGPDAGPQIAASSGACTVDGSIVRLHQTLRLTVRLSSVDDRRLLWAEHFRLETPADHEALDRLASLVAARLERAAIWRDHGMAELAGLSRPCSTCEWRQAGTPIEAVTTLPADL